MADLDVQIYYARKKWTTEISPLLERERERGERGVDEAGEDCDDLLHLAATLSSLYPPPPSPSPLPRGLVESWVGGRLPISARIDEAWAGWEGGETAAGEPLAALAAAAHRAGLAALLLAESRAWLTKHLKEVTANLLAEAEDENEVELHPVLTEAVDDATAFLRTIFPPKASPSPSAALSLMRRGLGEARLPSLMDAVASFPDSTPALLDVRTCMADLGGWQRVGTALADAFSRRLLQPGAATNLIVDVYVCTVRALLFLDPAGALLLLAGEPVRAYLRSRPDTIRYVASSFLDDESELFEEFAGGGSLGDGFDAGSDSEDDVLRGKAAREAADPLESTWTPAPRGAAGALRGRRADIVALLVDVFGGADAFLAEYSTLLAERLLQVRGEGATEADLRAVELMKARFGETSVRTIGVMLKDAQDSARLNASLNAPGVQVSVVSGEFWPKAVGGVRLTTVAEEDERISAEMSDFAAKYAEVMAPRKLCWVPSMSDVLVEMCFPGEEGEAEVEDGANEPIQVLLPLAHGKTLAAFDGVEVVEASESVPIESLRWLQSRKMVRAVTLEADEETGAEEAVGFVLTDPRRRGVEVDERGIINLVTRQGPATLLVDADEESDDEDLEGLEEWEGDGEGDEGNDEEMWEEAQQFVTAMLTNLGPLPVERIHIMLGQFVDDFGATVDEVRHFLADMVDDGKLLHRPSGEYALKQ
jgi:anaphase-promoting complex subunit 2